MLHGMWDLSSPTRDQTHGPYIGSLEVNHWSTREVSLQGQILSSFDVWHKCPLFREVLL